MTGLEPQASRAPCSWGNRPMIYQLLQDLLTFDSPNGGHLSILKPFLRSQLWVQVLVTLKNLVHNIYLQHLSPFCHLSSSSKVVDLKIFAEKNVLRIDYRRLSTSEDFGQVLASENYQMARTDFEIRTSRVGSQSNHPFFWKTYNTGFSISEHRVSNTRRITGTGRFTYYYKPHQPQTFNSCR